MRSSNRWAYLRQPGFNPPNRDCPVCTEPSKTYYIGGKTADGVTTHRWTCQHGHRWTTTEPAGPPDGAPPTG